MFWISPPLLLPSARFPAFWTVPAAALPQCLLQFGGPRYKVECLGCLVVDRTSRGCVRSRQSVTTAVCCHAFAHDAQRDARFAMQVTRRHESNLLTSSVFSFLLSMRDVKPPPSTLRSSQPRRWLRVALLVACCAAVAAPAPPPPAATAFSSLAPAYVTTLAGNGSTAIFSNPRSGSFGPDGCLYVADQSNNVIRKVSAAGVVTLVAGIVSSSAPAATSASGPPLSTALRTPYSTALDAAGNLYIAEYGGCMIKLLNATSNVLSLFAGVASSCSSTDGSVGTATFASPTGVYVDASGIVWVSENYAVRKIIGGQVTTLAGNNTVSGARVRQALI